MKRFIERIKRSLKVIAGKGYSGHFWRLKDYNGSIHRFYVDRVRNQCVLLSGKICYYDYMAGSKTSYIKCPVNSKLEYLGRGAIYSTDGIVQVEFK